MDLHNDKVYGMINLYMRTERIDTIEECQNGKGDAEQLLVSEYLLYCGRCDCRGHYAFYLYSMEVFPVR